MLKEANCHRYAINKPNVNSSDILILWVGVLTSNQGVLDLKEPASLKTDNRNLRI